MSESYGNEIKLNVRVRMCVSEIYDSNTTASFTRSSDQRHLGRLSGRANSAKKETSMAGKRNTGTSLFTRSCYTVSFL